MSLQAILSDKLGINKNEPKAQAAHTLTVQMPANVYELTKAMAVNLALDHPVFLDMLFVQMGQQVSASLEQLVQARRAQQHLDKLKGAYESTITQARTNLHSLIGEHSALSL